MARDGNKDAAALARADVGIAMDTGTNVAMKGALLTLVKGDLRGIATAPALPVASVTNMKQILTVTFVDNAPGIPLVAGLLSPFTGRQPSPMIAALAMRQISRRANRSSCRRDGQLRHPATASCHRRYQEERLPLGSWQLHA